MNAHSQQIPAPERNENGQIKWRETIRKMPPDLTIQDVADAFCLEYTSAREALSRHGYIYKKREYSKRKMFNPERQSLAYASLRRAGIDPLEAAKAVQSGIPGRSGAIEKAIRMVMAGHPPAVAAMYTGLTRAEAYAVTRDIREEAAQ